jgi:hypothetical protein
MAVAFSMRHLGLVAAAAMAVVAASTTDPWISVSRGGLTHPRASEATPDSAPWVPLPPPIACGDVMQPNNTFCIFLRNNCSDVASLRLTFQSIGPNNSCTVPPAQNFTNGTWFSFPSLSLAPNGTKGFATFTANVFYNATLTNGEQHEFGLGCIFSPTEFDCSFQPGKHFDADPDMQLQAPSYVGLIFFNKKK